MIASKISVKTGEHSGTDSRDGANHEFRSHSCRSSAFYHFRIVDGGREVKFVVGFSGRLKKTIFATRRIPFLNPKSQTSQWRPSASSCLRLSLMVSNESV